MATGDFNRDGKLDLVTANVGGNTVSVLLGSANGTFGLPLDSAAGYRPKSIAVGDFDGDGNLDLAAVNGYSYGDYAEGLVNVMFGNGNGSFQPPSRVGINYHYSQAQSVAAGDFNGDGTIDLAVASDAYSYWYYDYNEVRANVLISNGQDRTFSAQPTAPVYYARGNTRASVVTDFDGDGSLDFLVGFAGAGNDLVRILRGDGQGNLAPASATNWLIGEYGSLASLAVGDLDGDHAIDLVAQDRTNVKVRLGDGQGGFVPPPGGLSYPAGDRPIGVALGDFNHDGELDVATANYNSNDVSILRGYGDGTFALPEQFAAGLRPKALATGDFNGDGWLDVVTANGGEDTVSILMNNASWPQPVTFLSVSDAIVTEGNIGSINATFTVSLTAAVNTDVTVAYHTEDGSAVAGSDYAAKSGTVTIPAGQTNQTFTVAVLGDRTFEPAETFSVNLSAPTNAAIFDGQGIGTILDDEPRISINDVTATEGNKRSPKTFTFTVSLTRAYDQAVTVNYATANGTATAGDDYESTNGTITFAPGEITKTITVAVIGDKQLEADETFFVNLSGAIGGEITDSQGLGTILNDDRGGRRGNGNSSVVTIDAAIETWTLSGRKKRVM